MPRHHIAPIVVALVIVGIAAALPFFISGSSLTSAVALESSTSSSTMTATILIALVVATGIVLYFSLRKH